MIKSADMPIIEDVLEMGSGYVLGLNHPKFGAFFKEHGVDIFSSRYVGGGTSKANRMRAFLRHTPPPLVGRVLVALYEYRAAMATASSVPDARLTLYREIARRLGGVLPEPTPASPQMSENDILALAFRLEILDQLDLEFGVAEVLKSRMVEARTCVNHGAYLAAVIFAGSVLEGLCLGFGSRSPSRVNKAYLAKLKPEKVPPLYKWTLDQWINVLESIKVLISNVSKFGHALRSFRNYVHPNQQLSEGFTPDEHTAKISFHVVVAAIDCFRHAKGESP